MMMIFMMMMHKGNYLQHGCHLEIGQK